MAVLKVARQLNLVRDLDTVAVPGHDPVHIPEALLQRAIEHGRDALLVDAMALACAHPKSTAVPGALPGLADLPGLARPARSCPASWLCGTAWAQTGLEWTVQSAHLTVHA